MGEGAPTAVFLPSSNETSVRAKCYSVVWARTAHTTYDQ